MKKKTVVIMTACIVLLIGFPISLIANSIYGNPISAAVATSKIRSYVEETYPELDLVVPKATYNFKFSEYNSRVRSKTSEDTHFNIGWSRKGINDSYEYEIANYSTTIRRLTEEFDDAVEAIMKDQFLYETDIMVADMRKSTEDLSKLERDMELDIHNPPLPASLTVYILHEDVSYEFLSSRLLELHQLMEENKIPISSYTVVVSEPVPEGEKPDPDGASNHLIDFPVEKIASGNLIETIKAHQKEWEKENSK